MDDTTSACAGCADAGTSEPISGLSRRTFLTQGALAALGVALVACGGSGSDATAPASVSTTLKLSDYPALASVGGVALVSASGSPIAVVRTATSGTAQFVALSRICPHQGATVNAVSGGFNCPRHGARFDSTGTWTGGEHTSSMRQYATAYDAATGTITVG